MDFHRIVTAVLRVLLFAGLAVAYASAAAGLVGFIDARTVSLIILIGAAVAFVAMVFYFGVSDLALNRQLRRNLTFR
jgi:hypothetical protein